MSEHVLVRLSQGEVLVLRPDRCAALTGTGDGTVVEKRPPLWQGR